MHYKWCFHLFLCSHLTQPFVYISVKGNILFPIIGFNNYCQCLLLESNTGSVLAALTCGNCKREAKKFVWCTCFSQHGECTYHKVKVDVQPFFFSSFINLLLIQPQTLEVNSKFSAPAHIDASRGSGGIFSGICTHILLHTFTRNHQAREWM